MAAAGDTTTITTPSEREVLISHWFDAPRELVWEAYTRPEHLARWWGPAKYELIVREHDLRPGGKWHFVSRAADGGEHEFRGEFRELVRPERIVMTFEYLGAPGHISVDTATFEPERGGTRVTSRSVFADRADRDAMIGSGMESGVRESHERLAALLASLRKR